VAFLDWEIPVGGEFRSEEGAFIRHQVQPGETLLQLALEYGVDEADILLANDGIEDADHILVGQVILIPVEVAER
jgi:LysM repeat protein